MCCSPRARRGFLALERQLSEAVLDADLMEQRDKCDERQPHHREVVALDALDNRGAVALDSVSARLIHRLSSRDVRIDLVFGQATELDTDFLDARSEPFAPGDCDRCENGVLAA